MIFSQIFRIYSVEFQKFGLKRKQFKISVGSDSDCFFLPKSQKELKISKE